MMKTRVGVVSKVHRWEAELNWQGSPARRKKSGGAPGPQHFYISSQPYATVQVEMSRMIGRFRVGLKRIAKLTQEETRAGGLFGADTGEAKSGGCGGIEELHPGNQPIQ